MEIIHVKGSTYCLKGMQLMPFYKIDDRDIIMLDTGWGKFDRAGIDQFLTETGYQVKSIITSHTHVDHNGNNKYLFDKFGCEIAMPFFDAGLASDLMALKTLYYMMPPTFLMEDVGDVLGPCHKYIMGSDDRVTVCGVEFGVVHTPGHCPTHISIITPDNVFYLADAVMSGKDLERSRLPFYHCVEKSLETQEMLKGIKCSKYIIAHTGIHDDIDAVIDENIALTHRCAEGVLGLITEPMPYGRILELSVEHFRQKSDNYVRTVLTDRNVHSFVEYLVDKGDIRAYAQDGIIMYAPVQ